MGGEKGKTINFFPPGEWKKRLNRINKIEIGKQ